MPQLKQATSKINRYHLPSTASLPETEQAWVSMDIGEMLGGDVMDLMDGDKSGAGTLSCALLATRIKEWNFTEDGTPNTPVVPITADNVRGMQVEDLTYLLSQFNMPSGNQLDDKKKLN